MTFIRSDCFCVDDDEKQIVLQCHIQLYSSLVKEGSRAVVHYAQIER